ncbi:MAG TPA: C45 family peptidase [Thermoanaerobaculia bacterium]|nr:C45 family peptidase [Thermoanaerobaculia bacterium]
MSREVLDHWIHGEEEAPAASLLARSVTLRTVTEEQPGDRWQRHFAELWPTYRRWFLSEGVEARMSLQASTARLRLTMPELGPIYDRLCEVAAGAGAGELARRFLTLYRPPPYLAGCSQVLWTGDEPALVRNYDFDPALWEATVWRSSWSGRRVLAMSDCLWGALEGMNDAGLAVGLSFGGRRVVGDGFGIPLLVRYLLETCGDATEARAALLRVPSHMAYNLAVIDASGDGFVAYLTPGVETVITHERVVTNHQAVCDWPAYAKFSQTVERRERLSRALQDARHGVPLLETFLAPPVFTDRYDHSFGTLYTAVWRPRSGAVDLVWRDQRRTLRLDDAEDQEWSVVLRSGPVAEEGAEAQTSARSGR